MSLPAVRADEFGATPNVRFAPKIARSALPMTLLALERFVTGENLPDERLGIAHAA
jgi:hypothetical protein